MFCFYHTHAWFPGGLVNDSPPDLSNLFTTDESRMDEKTGASVYGEAGEHMTVSLSERTTV